MVDLKSSRGQVSSETFLLFIVEKTSMFGQHVSNVWGFIMITTESCFINKRSTFDIFFFVKSLDLQSERRAQSLGGDSGYAEPNNLGFPYQTVFQLINNYSLNKLKTLRNHPSILYGQDEMPVHSRYTYTPFLSKEHFVRFLSLNVAQWLT